MPEPTHIDRADDPRVACYADIRERELAARDGLFVGETLVVLEAMLARKAAVRSVLASPRMLARTAELLAAHGCEAPLLTAGDAVLEALTGIDLHRGVLAVAERAAFEPLAPDAYRPSIAPRTALVCEGITNIDNIGQLFRIAAAFAVDTSASSKRAQNRARSAGHSAARTAGTFSALPVETRRLLR